MSCTPGVCRVVAVEGGWSLAIDCPGGVGVDLADLCVWAEHKDVVKIADVWNATAPKPVRKAPPAPVSTFVCHAHGIKYCVACTPPRERR